jgi:ADP-ribose pyrophosphatase YjhB (NUDIX family)
MGRLGVNVAIVRDGQILLTKRRDFAIWCLPGGAVEAGESLGAAAVREAREETGLDVHLTRLIGLYSRPRWREGGAHEALFAADVLDGTLLTSTSETVEAGYFEDRDLPEPLFRWHYARVRDALDGRTGIVRVQDVAWLEDVKSRQELYSMRDRGELPPQVFERLCGPPDPGQDRIEVE